MVPAKAKYDRWTDGQSDPYNVCHYVALCLAGATKWSEKKYLAFLFYFAFGIDWLLKALEQILT